MGHSQRVWATRLLIFLVPLLLAAPFLDRAYFVDDSYFVEIATWLETHPQLPYHFRADDAGLQNRGWEENGFVRMVNPLVHHYYLAFIMKLGGANERALRFGCVLLGCFSALFIFGLARRLTENPLLATLLTLVTPAMWLTSYSLLIDSTMVFFAFGALYFFVRATESLVPKAIFHLLASGVFCGLAILSKYPAIFVVPLMLVWLLLRRKKLPQPWLHVLPIVLGILFLLLYSVWTARLYGRPHILAASARMVHVFGWAKFFIFFVFLSGALLVPLFSWIVAPFRTRVLMITMIVLATFLLASRWGGFSVLQGFLLGLWLVTSFLFVGMFADLYKRWVYPRDHFLAVWLVGFIAMMLLIMDWVAARYYCLVAPAVVFVVVRTLEIHFRERAIALLRLLIGFVCVASAALAYADYKQAAPSRALVSELQQKGFSGGPRHFFLGDSFTMSYLKQQGWVPCFPETEFQIGDWILSKDVTMPLVWFARKPVGLREIARFEYPSRFPVRVMDYTGSAGFYASVWGALPFTFTSGPLERFHIYEVVELRSNVPS